jgi:DNA repair protein RadA/Sms
VRADGRCLKDGLVDGQTIYTCRDCGGTSPKWLGKCPHCRAWNTLDEGGGRGGGGKKNRFQSLAAASRWPRSARSTPAEVVRTPTGQEELDRVLGGGIVPAAWC